MFDTRWWRSVARFEAHEAVHSARRLGVRAADVSNFVAAHRTYAAASARAGIAIPVEPFPRLGDRTSTTPADAHYLHQGAWVFRHLKETHPDRHVDIASSLMYLGFFAAVTPTEFVDIRPADIALPGLTQRKGSVLELPYESQSLASISCLHVIEHVGLGRYGDPLDPRGTERACTELARVLAPGGSLYLSVPVGRPRVSFNAHRVHSVEQIREYLAALQLLEFTAVLDDASLVVDCDEHTASAQEYACGMFRFTR